MTETTAITVIPFETPTLGDRSYLVHEGEVAFVVNPQRDIDRILAVLAEQGLRFTHVFESHVHNDETADHVALAQRELVRIGIDRPAAAATGKPKDWVAGAGWELASFAAATFADLAQVQHHSTVTVLDVRRADESAAIDHAFGSARQAGLPVTVPDAA